jgi:hypothetical protein
LNSIQSGPYKNIYNPENFFIGQQGIGAGNNWGAGYAAGEVVQEEVFDMIDREADGSDSLEVRHLGGGDRTFLAIAYECCWANLVCRKRASCSCIRLQEEPARDLVASS